FVKLVRGLVPDGKSLETVQIQRTGMSGLSTAVLTVDSKKKIDTYLKQIQSQHGPSVAQPSTRTGVLRALHLDEGWIVLVENGEEQKCLAAPGRVLDDVVEPLVNRSVKVT